MTFIAIITGIEYNNIVYAGSDKAKAIEAIREYGFDTMAESDYWALIETWADGKRIKTENIYE